MSESNGSKSQAQLQADQRMAYPVDPGNPWALVVLPSLMLVAGPVEMTGMEPHWVVTLTVGTGTLTALVPAARAREWGGQLNEATDASGIVPVKSGLIVPGH